MQRKQSGWAILLDSARVFLYATENIKSMKRATYERYTREFYCQLAARINEKLPQQRRSEILRTVITACCMAHYRWDETITQFVLSQAIDRDEVQTLLAEQAPGDWMIFYCSCQSCNDEVPHVYSRQRYNEFQERLEQIAQEELKAFERSEHSPFN